MEGGPEGIAEYQVAVISDHCKRLFTRGDKPGIRMTVFDSVERPLGKGDTQLAGFNGDGDVQGMGMTGKNQQGFVKGIAP